MTDCAVFHFDATLKCLICKIHGYAVHPTTNSITRHLRSKDHWVKGARLKYILERCMELPLSPDPNRLWIQSNPPHIPRYLRILDGYVCELCLEPFLTTSLELMQRHVARQHRQNVAQRPWQVCKLQTLFEETKNRHYRRLHEAGHSSCLTEQKDHALFHRQAETINNITEYHPVAVDAARHVHGIPFSALDLMFKSTSFRTVSRPLFSPVRVDSDNSMYAVFPGSDQDCLFFHALVYSLIRVSSTHLLPETQTIYLENMVVRLLKERIQAYQNTRQIAISTIGAVLLLKVASYKLRDTYQHDIHTKGVEAILRVSGRGILPENLQRAIFWQDLYASVLVRSQRRFKDFMTYEDFDSLPFQTLPVGFSRVKSHLPRELHQCIVDVIRFDNERREIALQTWSHRYRRLDGLQASIESRLEEMTRVCRESSPLAEAVRLATLFWCYCTWMEVWNDPLVPCAILRQMLDVLERSLSSLRSALIWQHHADVLHWLLYLVRDITLIENRHTRQIAPRYHELLQQADVVFGAITAEDLETARDQAETDFAPNPPWRRQGAGDAPLFA